MSNYSAEYYRHNRERIREKQRIYGRDHRDRIRVVYNAIIARCYLSTHKSYDHYGGKGIRMCQQWLDSFEAFKDWLLANGWERGLHVHRIDNDGNYSPENCEIVTVAENNQHRNTIKLDWDKVAEIRRLALEGFSTTEIAKMFGVSHQHTSDIINGKKWARGEKV